MVDVVLVLLTLFLPVMLHATPGQMPPPTKPAAVEREADIPPVAPAAKPGQS